jgi:hypothetical protein
MGEVAIFTHPFEENRATEIARILAKHYKGCVVEITCNAVIIRTESPETFANVVKALENLVAKVKMTHASYFNPAIMEMIYQAREITMFRGFVHELFEGDLVTKMNMALFRDMLSVLRHYVGIGDEANPEIQCLVDAMETKLQTMPVADREAFDEDLARVELMTCMEVIPNE